MFLLREYPCDRRECSHIMACLPVRVPIYVYKRTGQPARIASGIAEKCKFCIYRASRLLGYGHGSGASFLALVFHSYVTSHTAARIIYMYMYQISNKAHVSTMFITFSSAP
jgi:hypothetical protein